MRRNKLVVRLRGGLGNQMFQYAAAFAAAQRNSLKLVADVNSGFDRDKVYRRHYSLDYFQVRHAVAGLKDRFMFTVEDIIDKYWRSHQEDCSEKKRPWGTVLKEYRSALHERVLRTDFEDDIWLDGYWQSETYFQDYAEQVEKLYNIPTPADDRFISLAEDLNRETAVAVGIRLYEEAPIGAHNPSPFMFFEKAAKQLAVQVKNPVFYLFCTVRAPIEDQLKLPGCIRYITHDDGYGGELERLWLLSQFRYHIISHSSFYWWGAWMAERKINGVCVHAHNLFDHMIPSRWVKYE